MLSIGAGDLGGAGLKPVSHPPVRSATTANAARYEAERTGGGNRVPLNFGVSPNMTKKIVIRALVIAGLAFASTAASFAQAPVEARTRRVAVDKINQQPVAASVVAVQQAGALQLSAEQRGRLQSMNSEAATLHAERAKLWEEYNQIISRPNYNDDVAASQGAPRMLRIVEINNRLAAIASNQESQVAGILNATQRRQLSSMIGSVKAGGR